MTHKLNLIIGKNIRNYRKRHGWTQKYLGALLGITAQQIQKYENATNAISAEKLVTLVGMFQCSLNDMFDGVQCNLFATALENTYLEKLANDFLSTCDSPALQEHIIQIVHTIAKTHHKQRKAGVKLLPAA